VCMPRQGSMQQIRQYQSGVQAKRHAAAIFVVNGFLFSVCMPRLRSMQQMRQYQSGVQAKRHAAAIFVVNGFLLLCACHGKAPCNRCGNIRCASKPRWRKKDTQLRYLLCLIICLHAMATFHATDTTMLVVNVDTTMLVVNLGGGEYIVAAKSLLPWFCQE